MKIKLTQVKVDGELQSRDSINEAVVQEYTEVIREGGTMPPVTMFYDGANYHLADGWHRFFAHKSAGFPEIEANIIEGTRRDAILYSTGANDDHGLRRTNADKHKAIKILLDDMEWSEWNDSQIARQCKVSSMLVNKVRKLLLGDEEPAPKKVKRGDTVYEMKTENIGSKATPKEEDIPEVDERELKLEEMATEFKAVAEENEELKAKIAVGLMEGSEEDKKKAKEIIEEQAERIKSLEAQVKGLTASRDAYQLKNAELIKQVNYWKKQAQKAA